MTTYVRREALVALIDGDNELIEILISNELIVEEAAGFPARAVDRVLVSRTLLRELEVNVAGLEVILRLREELAVTRARLSEIEP